MYAKNFNRIILVNMHTTPSPGKRQTQRVSVFNFATSNTKSSFLAHDRRLIVLPTIYRKYIHTHTFASRLISDMHTYRAFSSSILMYVSPCDVLLRCCVYICDGKRVQSDIRRPIYRTSFCAESCKTMRWRRRKFVYRRV